MSDLDPLSKREQQITDIIYARGEATAGDVVDGLSDPPTRDAIRALLRILEQKGHLTHRKEGREFVYRAVRSRGRIGKSALRRVLNVFYDGSVEKALAAYLAGPKSEQLTLQELERLAELIEQAKRKGK
jgi:predicted transcriptional regulator